MNKPALFDVIELLLDLPEYNIYSGAQGAIVECYGDDKYEVEFTNEDGETLAMCVLSNEQFIVVWRASTQSWVPISERVLLIVNRLSESRQEEVLELARSLYGH